MMEVIRDWLVGITCAAMVVALAESLTPQGTIRKIGRFTGGLVLLLAVVQPVMKLDEAPCANPWQSIRLRYRSTTELWRRRIRL